MLLRTALVGALCVGCAHPPAEKPSAEPTRPSAATPDAVSPTPVSPTSVSPAPAPLAPALPAPATTPVDFARDVRPLLESRCQPCHFAGGRMYERLPFDRPETVRQLGPKLFTRIRDESSQATIRAFLSQAQ